MDIIVVIKAVISFIVSIFYLTYKNIKTVKKIIKWFKSLFTKTKTNEDFIQSSSIPDPKGPPPNRKF
jgi:hypothetical protein